MAQIDFKNVDTYIRDGYKGLAGASAAKVNLMAGYALGATSMTIDGVVGIIPVGDSFTLGGLRQRYKVTAHTETSSNTTAITFTPGLVSVVVDNDPITWAPNQLQIRIGEGNLQWTEKRPITYTKDRGKLDTVRLGDEEPVEVKLDATWVFLKASSGGTVTIEDALKNRGGASTWVTSSEDPCEPYAVDLVAEYTPPCASEELEIYTIKDFRYEDLGQDFKTGQISISGKSNFVEVDVERVAA